MYLPSRKTRNFIPYQPTQGNYRVRLDANESFLLPTDEDRIAMASAAADVALNRYPDPLATDLCSDFANLYSISSDYVTAGNGSDELISIIYSALLEKGEKVLTLTPDFSMYGFYSSIAETICVNLSKREDLTIDVDLVLKAIKEEKIRMIIFSNPCNPTSLGLKASEVRRLITGTDALVVVDEAYMDFWDQSLIKEAHEYDNLIILRTCSKALGLAALRIGFAIANTKLTQILRAAKSPYNVNSVTQAMARVVLKNSLYKTVYNDILIVSRDMLIDGLRKLESEDLIDKVYDSCTNFAYIKLDDAEGVFDWLADRGIIVRKLGNNFLRITAGREEENKEVVSAMSVYLRRKKGVKVYENRCMFSQNQRN
jgi:histidinol-phosphate aminotransferase